MYPPLEKYGISSPYGPRGGGFHRGLDIPTPMNTPLPAVFDGVIAFEGSIGAAAAGYSDEIICILQGNGQFAVYGHLSKTVVNTEQRVKKGDIIAYSGNSGYVLPKPTPANPSAGSHLHIELAKGTKAPSLGILAYPSIDITPLLRNYEGGTEVTKEESFGRCFMTKYHRWPTKAEEAAWKKSGLADYTWVQRYNAPYPSVNDRLALELYQKAREKAGSKYPGGAAKFAQDRLNGGTDFKKVIEGDMKHYIAKERLASELLSTDAPEPLSKQDEKDLENGRSLRALVKEANG